MEREEPGRRAVGHSMPRRPAKPILAGVTVHGRVDRIDRLSDGGLAIIDYKTGQPPTQKAVTKGLRCSLGFWG